MMSDHEVQTPGDSMSEFNVKFHGPKDSAPPPLSDGALHGETTPPRAPCAMPPAPWPAGAADPPPARPLPAAAYDNGVWIVHVELPVSLPPRRR